MCFTSKAKPCEPQIWRNIGRHNVARRSGARCATHLPPGPRTTVISRNPQPYRVCERLVGQLPNWCIYRTKYRPIHASMRDTMFGFIRNRVCSSIPQASSRGSSRYLRPRRAFDSEEEEQGRGHLATLTPRRRRARARPPEPPRARTRGRLVAAARPARARREWPAPHSSSSGFSKLCSCGARAGRPRLLSTRRAHTPGSRPPPPGGERNFHVRAKRKHCLLRPAILRG